MDLAAFDPPAFSPDQAKAWAHLSHVLAEAGIDLGARQVINPAVQRTERVCAVLGRAGSGKSVLLVTLAKALLAAEVEPIRPDFEPRPGRIKRSFAVLAPTNKAASVLRARGIPATTIHRVLYAPIYDPKFEEIIHWLTGTGARPRGGLITEAQLDQAQAFFVQTRSVPAALAAVGLRGIDFVRGWTRRKRPLDIGLVDESSMLDAAALADLRAIFSTLVLFGDPAQLAPVGGAGPMVFDLLPPEARLELTRVHRQEATSPILDLADALFDPAVEFRDFSALVRETARRDSRVVWAEAADAALMARTPLLVWRNSTRFRMIHAFRAAYGLAPNVLAPGEPLVCDGLEIPLDRRKQRLALELRGLIKGAQVIYLGPGRKPGFARIFLIGAEDPRFSVAAIVKIEQPDAEPALMPFTAEMGAVFIHGAALTIHKAQGSQWPEVQVFAPDLAAAAYSGRTEGGLPLWKRLAYVAITRAEERLYWVVRDSVTAPTSALSAFDFDAPLTALSEAQARGA